MHRGRSSRFLRPVLMDSRAEYWLCKAHSGNSARSLAAKFSPEFDVERAGWLRAQRGTISDEHKGIEG
jgi:hypothetical protein